MNDNFKFWIATIASVIFFSLAFSIAPTGLFHILFASLGTFALFAIVYYLGKQKLNGLINFIRYVIDKGRK